MLDPVSIGLEKMSDLMQVISLRDRAARIVTPPRLPPFARSVGITVVRAASLKIFVSINALVGMPEAELSD
jgi:hypothetical protein